MHAPPEAALAVFAGQELLVLFLKLFMILDCPGEIIPHNNRSADYAEYKKRRRAKRDSAGSHAAAAAVRSVSLVAHIFSPRESAFGIPGAAEISGGGKNIPA